MPADTSVSPQLDFERPHAEYTLYGRTALITGGASGIGYAIAMEFARLGAQVLIADISSTGEDATARLRSDYPRAHIRFEQTDVTRWEDQVRAFDAAWNLSAGTGIDIVIPAAGVAGESIAKSALSRVDENDSDIFPEKPPTQCLSVNLTGVLYTTTLALRYFVRSARAQDKELGTVPGHLLFFGSITGYMESPLSTEYVCSKFGVRGIWKSMRATSKTWEGKFRTNLVAPSFVRTPLAHDIIDHAKKQGIRIADPEDVVAAVVACCCQHDINGRAIAVPASGNDAQLRAGALNFDLRDDEEGMDGAAELYKHIKAGSFGSLR